MRSRIIASAFLLLATVALAAPRAHIQALPPATPLEAESSSDLAWYQQMEADLVAEKFDDLDRIADQLRRDKTRLPGGDWKLALFYGALDRPLLNDKDSADHLEHLRHWMTLRPESITARIALATSLHRWAWVARGHGLANTVTPEAWSLFNQRTHEADVILEGSQDMHTMDPQWFREMMGVALAEGWDNNRTRDIFERGIQFEPGYFYLYRLYANYLLPKWYGHPGDSASFAKTSADHLGGDAGDILYFQIATILVKRGDGNFPVEQLDWDRIQSGYTALIQAYGSTNRHTNELAFMAFKFNDKSLAHQQFALIGDHWSRTVWRDREFFDRIRDWSGDHTEWPSSSPESN